MVSLHEYISCLHRHAWDKEMRSVADNMMAYKRLADKMLAVHFVVSLHIPQQ